ncbi:hypothetical protein CRENBAI_013435 [Crenichthys baileyi]|uniref:MABP domain-containing protein n=1 Tax=Crenichthys baileyi TaxID=28760 RepID=A0AAV9SRI6_9TELE
MEVISFQRNSHLRGGAFPPQLSSQQIYKDQVRSSGTAAFRYPQDFSQPITVCRHEDNMSEYITEIDISLNKSDEEHLKSNGFIQNPVNLNKESPGGKIFMWYKKGKCPGITRIQFTFNDHMSEGLAQAGYTQIKKDLNEGTGGDNINLWYYKGSTAHDIPVIDLFISTEREDEAQLFCLGWEKLGCDMNQGNGGCRIYLWVKRNHPVYINDISATADFHQDAVLFKEGYTRLDENTNRGAGGASVFIWYRLAINSQNAVRDLKISDNCNPPSNYKKVNQDLNQGTGGTPLFLYYTKEQDHKSRPIETISLIVKRIGCNPYRKAGVKVIDRNLNEGNEGVEEFLSFYQEREGGGKVSTRPWITQESGQFRPLASLAKRNNMTDRQESTGTNTRMLIPSP